MDSIKNRIVIFITLALLAPLTAWAAPKINLLLTAEKDVVVEENGEKVTKRIEATEVIPGETLIYTISYENSGDESATNVAIVDPIPEGSSYIPGSASQVDKLTFSIDNGKSYKKPLLLTYEVTDSTGNKEKKVASPEKYTHIRWVIPAIEAGGKGAVSFKVLMK